MTSISSSNMADLTLRCNYTMTLAGPTGSGKTTFIEHLIKSAPAMYDVKPGPFHYFYKVHQKKFEQIEQQHGVIFHDFMCTMSWIKKHISPHENATIILDDLARDMTADTAEIFSVGSHHFSVNIIIICHNLFDRNPAFRTISLNTRYLIIMKNPRDNSTIHNFARQFDPGNNRRMVSIYKDATERPFSYLFIDLDQMTQEDLRLRSNIFFEGNRPMEVYKRL